MSAELVLDYRRARRAYEYGRLRSSVGRAFVMTALVALLGWATVGRAALWLLPFPFAIWVFAHWFWRGFERGALYGVLGGVLTHLLPMSILRPCCDMNARSEEHTSELQSQR